MRKVTTGTQLIFSDKVLTAFFLQTLGWSMTGLWSLVHSWRYLTRNISANEICNHLFTPLGQCDGIWLHWLWSKQRSLFRNGVLFRHWSCVQLPNQCEEKHSRPNIIVRLFLSGRLLQPPGPCSTTFHRYGRSLGSGPTTHLARKLSLEGTPPLGVALQVLPTVTPVWAKSIAALLVPKL